MEMAERQSHGLRKVIEKELQPNEIIRSRRKTLSVTVDAFGRVIVRAPLGMSEERIFSFLTEKRSWILRHKSQTRGTGIELPPENLDGFCFLLLGKRTKIRLYEGQRVRFESGGEEGADVVFLPETNSRERLVKWLKANAKRVLLKIVAARAAEMGATYPSLTVNSAKTRWGSCSQNNALHFSFRLLYAPVAVIDYVAVHELAHVFHKNHSKAFWAVVENYVPDRKAKRAWLKNNAGLMEIF